MGLNMIEQARTILETHYELGEILEISELLGGTVNRTYAVSFLKDGIKQKLAIRAYNTKVTEREIKFEHALIRHLRQNGFHLAADVIPRKNGTTYIWEESLINGDSRPTIWAVFEFLGGEDRYAWIDTNIAAADMESAAGVLADLHHASQGFVSPLGCDRDQPEILQFLPTFRQSYEKITQQAGDRVFDRRFLQERDNILKATIWADIPESDRQGLPTLAIHCDFHQGNLKYRGSEAVGVFDFDWSKIDIRLFDVALALFYFCSSWGESDATRDSLYSDKLALFLGAYCRQCRVLPGLEPFNQQERKYLPAMLMAANLFVLQWTINDYYAVTEPDDDAYGYYFEHGVSIMNWIPQQVDLINRIAAQSG
jgi:homoserine kinase type II